MEKTKNGLKLFQLKSSIKKDYGDKLFIDFNDLEKFLSDSFKTNGFIIVYLDYKVIIRNYENGKILFMNDEKPFEPEFIQKLRLFNNDQELYIWRTEAKWKSRLRSDETGNEVFVIDANQILFGTEGMEFEKGFTKLTERRGTEIILPISIEGIDDKQNRVKIRTRNYIDYNEIGQAGYSDSRFVEFTIGLENNILGGKDNG